MKNAQLLHWTLQTLLNTTQSDNLITSKITQIKENWRRIQLFSINQHPKTMTEAIKSTSTIKKSTMRWTPVMFPSTLMPCSPPVHFFVVNLSPTIKITRHLSDACLLPILSSIKELTESKKTKFKLSLYLHTLHIPYIHDMICQCSKILILTITWVKLPYSLFHSLLTIWNWLKINKNDSYFHRSRFCQIHGFFFVKVVKHA